ncbi:MAG: RluA family pseudouridine synthase, partial [Christensenellales bacterium]
MEILFEDNHIIVVQKPQNVLSQGDETGDQDMLNMVKNHIKEKYQKPGNVYVGLVHRLDRPTGGVMVFAKTSKAAERLSLQIQNGEFKKEYLCVVCGHPRMKADKLINYLEKDPKTNNVRIVPQSQMNAKRAELDYEVKDEKDELSLVKVRLATGRSHQIRVQMASIKCPIFGDYRYGKGEIGQGYNLA